MEAGKEIAWSAARRAHGNRTRTTRGLGERLRGVEPATLLFAASVLVSGGFLLHWLSRLTFWRDEWALLLDRREWSLDVLLDPFVEQLLAIPILLYKVLVGLFGIDSPVPFQIPSTLMFLLSVVLLFVYVRRRVGGWLALAMALPILFLGPAWDDLLFPFQVSFFGSTACGLGALLALDRGDRAGRLLATILLATSLFFSHVGIPFVAAIALEIALGRDRFRRAYIVAAPTALWALWYLGWGHEATNFVSLHNLTTLGGYVPDGYASSLSSYVGLAGPRDDTAITPLDWGRPLLVIAVGLAALRLYRLGATGLRPRLFTVIAIPTVFWSLTGLNASFFGEATSGRYQYLGVIGLALIAAELARGLRVPRPGLLLAGAISVAAALANFSTLENTAAGLAGIGQQQRAGLGALELVRDEVAPDFVLTVENSGVDYLGIVTAAKYFSAIAEYGSPAYTPAELVDAPEIGQIAADMVLVDALGVGLEPVTAVEPEACLAAAGLEAGPTVVDLPAGGVVVRIDQGRARMRLRRFASESFPFDLGSFGAGEGGALAIPADASAKPWQLELTGRGSASICGLGEDRPR